MAKQESIKMEGVVVDRLNSNQHRVKLDGYPIEDHTVLTTLGNKNARYLRSRNALSVGDRVVVEMPLGYYDKGRLIERLSKWEII